MLQHTDKNMSLAYLKKIELLETADKSSIVAAKVKGKSCCFFAPQNPVRRFCRAIIEFKYYDTILMTLIGVSTILLTLDNPLQDQNGTLALTL